MALLATTASNQARAQKSNQKRSRMSLEAWERRRDNLKPLQLKEMVEENHRLKVGNKKLTEKVQLNEQELEKWLRLKAKIDALRKQRGLEITDDYNNLDQLFASKQESDASMLAADKHGQPYTKGVVFRVQIGAYRKRDLSDVLEGNDIQEFDQEQEEDVNKYVLGQFRDYQKANRLKKELRAMGVKDAWIVPFKDGERVPLKAVLDYVHKKQ